MCRLKLYRLQQLKLSLVLADSQTKGPLAPQTRSCAFSCSNNAAIAFPTISPLKVTCSGAVMTCCKYSTAKVFHSSAEPAACRQDLHRRRQFLSRTWPNGPHGASAENRINTLCLWATSLMRPRGASTLNTWRAENENIPTSTPCAQHHSAPAG